MGRIGQAWARVPWAGRVPGSVAAVFAVALAVRLLALAQLRGTAWNDVLLGDAAHFDAWGLRLAQGQSDRGTVFFQAPLYPYLLGALYKVFGHVPDLVRALQCVGGAVAAALVTSTTRRLASGRAALCAGLFAALYAPAVWYDLQVEKTSFSLLLTAALLWWLVPRADAPNNWRRAAAAGVTVSALALLRENAHILALPVAWALGRGAGDRAARRRLWGAFAAALALCLLPVALHNLDAGGAPLPTTSNAGVNFWIGNGEGANGQYRELVPGRGDPAYEQQDARRLAEQATGRKLSPTGVSRFWLGRALADIGAGPGRFASLLAHKARLLVDRHEVMDAVSLEAFQDASWGLRALSPFSFGLLLPLAIAGFVAARRRPEAWPLAAAAAVLAASIVAFFVMGRFRLGLAPLLFPAAGLALDAARDWRRERAAMALLVLVAVLAWWPGAAPGDPRAAAASNLANEYLRRSDFPAAEKWAAEAWRRADGSAEAAYNLGLALRWQGKFDQAQAPLQAAMRLQPAYAPDCLAEVGACRAGLGDLAGARQALNEALRLRPGHEAARRYLALVEQGAAAGR